MSNEQISRVKAAIVETGRLLARELAYQAKFQKADVIASYRAHLAKLNDMVGA